MLSARAVVLCALIHKSWGIDLSFPPNFKFGAATSAIQIEGGWNADGKGENIWDRYVHENPGKVKNNGTPDVASDSYHLWREDIKAAAKMKLQFYRFSINWPRILPTGFPNKLNNVGVKYYNDLIDGLLAEGIEPIITLYHWELPVRIQDLGGWMNPLIAKWFGDYARVIYSLYADRVKTWLTINEPTIVCDVGHFAPTNRQSELAPYLCNRHVMLAHANAYRIFEKEFRPKYPGKISIANHLLWIEPTAPKYMNLAVVGRELQGGRYSHPIYSKEGGWPLSVEKLLHEVSQKQGYKESILPAFTEEEIAFVKGTADFYAMNHYTTYLIRPAKRGEDLGRWFFTGSPEMNAILENPPNATYGYARNMPLFPEGIRRQMAWVKQQYGDMDILITESGFSSSGYQLDDGGRVDYFKAYLEQVLLSIKVDNVSVVGYAAWSLIDNFEWMDGFTSKFGLYQVDFEHPNRTRTPRTSAHYLTCVISNRTLDVPETCYKHKHLSDSARRNGRSTGRRLVFERGLLLLNILLVLSFIL